MPGFRRDTVGGVIRQGIRIAGVDVVIVAVSVADIDEVRAITEAAVTQYGPAVLTIAGHPPVEGDQPVAAPVLDQGRLLGYVELARARGDA
jgi:hypothetical protein